MERYRSISQLRVAGGQRITFSALTWIFLLMSFLVVDAQESKPVSNIAAIDDHAQAIRQIVSARQLIEKGINDQDALRLVWAARIFRKLLIFDGTIPQKVGASPLDVDPSTQETFVQISMAETFDNSVRALLPLARQYAKDNTELSNLIAETAATAKFGKNGTAYLDFVPKNSIGTYVIQFGAKKSAAIFIESQESKSELNLIIRDRFNKLICEDRKSGPTAHCEWTPIESGEFYVQVINAQGQDQNFIMVTS